MLLVEKGIYGLLPKPHRHFPMWARVEFALCAIGIFRKHGLRWFGEITIYPSRGVDLVRIFTRARQGSRLEILHLTALADSENPYNRLPTKIHASPLDHRRDLYDILYVQKK